MATRTDRTATTTTGDRRAGVTTRRARSRLREAGHLVGVTS